MINSSRIKDCSKPYKYWVKDDQNKHDKPIKHERWSNDIAQEHINNRNCFYARPYNFWVKYYEEKKAWCDIINRLS